MMRSSGVARRQMRPYYNLPSKSEHGRRMTGFLTPYRHWMWKQNELWRNVHEAQFEHLRKVYKRQWLESFRVNADEYIYKYNITKAAQLAQWEHEMQGQETKRRESQQMAQGRQALKKKHLDLLREFHERQFFYWYERASERLHYMTHINYIPQSSIQDHIERELDKYVVGAKTPYALNFVGQMPMIEDAEGNIVQVPANLMTNHATENPDGGATMYQPPESTAAAEEKLLQMMASAQEEELHIHAEDTAAWSESIEDMDRTEEEKDADRKVARSMEETSEDREVSRRAYIDRGKTGSKTIFRRPRFEDDGNAPPASETGTTPMRRRKSKLDKAHALQEKWDAAAAMTSAKAMKPGVEPDGGVKRGEIKQVKGRVRDRVVIPSLETLQKSPELMAGNQLRVKIRSHQLMERAYGINKKKKGGGDEDA
ncbi:putative mitochondrial hypothetical protein [Leptomonas pyrrhocoris]|uniref:Uncharacterized protein n=1 Tax=Leptomonas pyrrhocoris TaxID=157538 RepID=A0A0N0VHR4_LEPPY|nr:putative mitochondrial hypothetical protein [Leptomonas pyrrhocoris]KPA86404.1 putative mitochondrial hypothetical protein [Leptomonas pyrrhocoris]|eukprot:XP_015664843.1 putative mitochondrial hypothetical protein [Leptomonas pyrrhocoris]